MRQRILTIWSVLLVLVVSIAVLVPGCDGDGDEGEQCHVEVRATLDGVDWTGPVQYTLTGPGASSPITGTSVSDIFTADCGSWTCTYVSGGPSGAYFVDITPSTTQSVSGGQAIVFTLNFELEGDGVEEEMCEINVRAYLCDDIWTGPVEYTLTGSGAASPVTGTNVHTMFFGGEYCGEWTCAYVSGGPPGAYFVDITPSPTQSVSDGGIIDFCLNFELDQDASIEFLSWAISGPEVAPNTAQTAYDVTEYDIIDVRYKQRVDGCEGKVVPVNETSELWVHYYSPAGGPDVDGHVLGDPCCVPLGVLYSAVFKDPLMAGPVSLVPSINGVPVANCTDFVLPWGQDVTLDIETAWQLPKSIEQWKFIRWLCIGGCDEHHCSLFELYQPDVPVVLELRCRAKVALVDDEDVNPNNDSTDWSPPLYIRIVPPGP